MPEVAQPAVAEAVIALLQETFEGPSGASTYFIDNDPRAGLLPAIEALTPAQVSLSPWPKAPSIAGHVHHIAFHLEMSAAWLRGDREDRDWSRSWTVREVDGEAWDRVRAEVRRRYEELLRALGNEPAALGEGLPTTIGALAHAAYHLGAIRQRIAAAAAA